MDNKYLTCAIALDECQNQIDDKGKEGCHPVMESDYHGQLTGVLSEQNQMHKDIISSLKEEAHEELEC